MKKEKAEKKKKGLGLRKADLRLLLIVAVLVLAVMGIFAWAFRQIHIGYVEEDGYVISTSEVYSSLNKGAEEDLQLLLTSVKSNDEVFARGGSYYVGADMTEYESVYPLYANNGQTLYFMTDSAQLVTEEFELLSTYQGMFVAGGYSFNSDREQADIETIYLVKLKNGLYENALLIRFAGDGEEYLMDVNSIALFGTSSVRWFEQDDGVLSYYEIEDASDLSVYIGDQVFSYPEFLEKLNGASTDSSPQTDSSEITADAGDEGEAEEEERETVNIKSVNTGSREGSDNETGDDGSAESSAKEESGNGTASSGSGSASGSGSSSSGSGSSSGGGGSDSGSSAESSGDADNGGEATGEHRTGSSASAETAYQAPKVSATIVSVGTYYVEFYVTIEDEGGYLKKVTTKVLWDDSDGQRKSVREEGTYTISNLPSDTDCVLRLEVKYRNSAGEYVVAVLDDISFHTLSIEEGTNVLYLDYSPDRSTREVDEEGDYDQIYSDRIEIQDLAVYEVGDAALPEDTTTMDYVRYFRIRIYYADSGEQATSFLLSNSQKKAVLTELGATGDIGLDWMSDTEDEITPDTDYYYEFELLDRYGESLQVVYGPGTKDESRYDSNDELLTGTASDRKSYTCSVDPTGKLQLGSASYEKQVVTVSLTNPDKEADIIDLYLTEKDQYGRYIVWSEDDGDITGSVGSSRLEDYDNARFMLMTGVKIGNSNETYPLYAGAADLGAYNGEASYTWSKLTLPAFASSVYTISLNACYSIGDRKGDGSVEGTDYYTKTLATRSNARTSALSTLGNVSYSRQAGDATADSVSYTYTSTTISSSLQALLYKYEYELVNAGDESDVPLSLRISKVYSEITTEDQGIILTTPDGETEAEDWSLNYSCVIRDADGNLYTVSGKITYDGNGSVVRTVSVTDSDGNEVTDLSYESECSFSVTDTSSNSAILSAFYQALKMDSVELLLTGEETDDGSTTYSDYSISSAAAVTLDFADITDGYQLISSPNEDYAIGTTASQLYTAFMSLAQDTADSDKTWSAAWLYALSAKSVALNFTVSGLESNETYTASSAAYAYQSGSEDESGDPVITKVTSTSTTLSLSTLKGEPVVNMNIFTTSTELTLFDFYVYDKDDAIIASGKYDCLVRVTLYEYDEETGEETQVDYVEVAPLQSGDADSEDAITEEQTQDIVFSNLSSGTTYIIKVTALAYDDGSGETQYNYLIGEDSGGTYWTQENGVWQVVVGETLTTGLLLEEVLNEDPFTLENQLIDYSTDEDENTGWELGTLDASTGEAANSNTTWYRTTPLIDLWEDTDGDGEVDSLSWDDMFVLRAIYGNAVYFYDTDGEYLGYCSVYVQGTGSEATGILTLAGQPLSGNTRSYTLDEIRYARVIIYNTYSDQAFFGRLDAGYFTTDDDSGDSSGAATDVWGQLLEGGNYWTDVTSKGYSGSYYSNKITISGGEIFLVTGQTSSGGGLERLVRFYEADGTTLIDIRSTGENGSSTYAYSSNTRRVKQGMLFVAPQNAKYIEVGYSSSDASAENLGLYILSDKDIVDDYLDAVSALTVTGRKSLNSSGGQDTADVNYEVTSKFKVNAGDVYLLASWGQYVAFYSGDTGDTFVSRTSASSQSFQYVVVPEGVTYMAVQNYRWSATNTQYDLSITNAQAAANNSSDDGNACYSISFLYCGNLQSVYESKILATGTEKAGLNKTESMYANLRVHIADAEDVDESSFGSGAEYWIDLYGVEWDDETEISDEDLDASWIGEYAVSEIDADTGLVSINTCHTLPVEAGYSYKVVLRARASSGSDEVDLGTVYFSVRSSSQPVYGISSEAQVMGMRNDNTGDYILNKDITFTSNCYYNGGTFYGVFDLQGHTLTNTRAGALFDNIGSASKKTGTVKNGTLAFERVRTSSSTGMAYLTGTNYGTLENLNFTVNVTNEVLSSSGSTVVYDNSMWNSETYVQVISYNYGTLCNFTVEYEADLISCREVGFVRYNYGTIENGYVYGDGCLMGGHMVGGLVCYNQSAGVVRGIYSTINTMSNATTGLGGNITSSTGNGMYNGTIIAINYGKAEGLLATGNVYEYTTTKSSSGNYSFSSGSYYLKKGCAVGTTSNRMDTTESYYTNVGSNRRVSYSSAYDERVEGALLVDPSWFEELYDEQTSGSGLDMENLSALLSSGYYPWVEMGVAADKYSIRQPYLVLDVSSSSFDLIKSEVTEYVYDDDGFATAYVTFTLNNPGYYVSNILANSLEINILTQGENEDTGFYEVNTTVTVSDTGEYVSDYYIRAVYYQITTGGSKSSITYASSATNTSSNGSRILEANFYYPLKDTQDWTEIFLNSEYSDWNFRIWNNKNSNDAADWDFSLKYEAQTSAGTTVERWPDSVRTTTFTGKLDGTMYEKDASGKWVVAYDDTGAVKCHTLKNLCSYNLNYSASLVINSTSGVTAYNGSALYNVKGSVTNLNLEDFTSGVLRSYHASAGVTPAANITKDTVTWEKLDGTTETMTQLYANSTQSGFIGYLQQYSELENVHIIGGYVGGYRNGGQQMIGSLVGQSQNYNSFTDCSVTGVTLVTSSYATNLYAGGMTGYSGSNDSYLRCYAADMDIKAVNSTHASFNSYGVGGLVGYMYYGTVTNCYTGGSLTSAVQLTGGLIGKTESTTEISASYSAMSLSLSAGSGGGLVGGNIGTLTVLDSLYTGALSAGSSSGTIHLIVGNNTLSLTLSGCYAYQPNLDEDSSLVDSSLEGLLSYSQLTSDFYTGLLGSSFLSSWSTSGSSFGISDSYLPALADGDGNLLGGQVVDGECYVPAIATEELKITDIYAFKAEDRYSIRTALRLTDDTKVADNEWYGWTTTGADENKTYTANGSSFNTLISSNSTATGVTSYDAHDVEFTLSLGTSYTYAIAGIEIEGLDTGEDLTTPTTERGVATPGMFTECNNYTYDNEDMAETDNYYKTFLPENLQLNVKTARYEIEPLGSGSFRIRLFGVDVTSYQDTYNITISFTNGLILKQSFQFLNADGDEEAKYLEISNAYEWNLYLGSSGSIVTAAQEVLDSTTNLSSMNDSDVILTDNAGDSYTKAQITTYANSAYRGYATESVNIRITGDIDFKALTGLFGLDSASYTEDAVLNVVANNVCGETGDSGSPKWTISNLSVEGPESSTRGLFRSIGGSLTDLAFRSITIKWNSKQASSDSGLVGTLYGGMDNCDFDGITLTGGNYNFGIVGTGVGVMNDVSLKDVFVESDAYRVGGLVGVLTGDLTDVTASGLDVSGTYQIGGLVGLLYSSEHETNGHAIVGGTDYTESEEGTGDYAGWLKTLLSDEDNYRVSGTGESRDSLSYDYVLVDNVSVTDASVSALRYYAGGIVGQQTYATSTNMGRGYLILQDVAIKDVSVAAMRAETSSVSDANVGGIGGAVRSVLANNIDAENVTVEANENNYAGGLFGRFADQNTYDYSAYGSDGARVSHFLSVIADVDCKDISVSARSEVGGLYGYGWYYTIQNDVNIESVTVLASGIYVGGMWGRIGYNVYTNGLTAKTIRVYNADSSVTSNENYYTGGLAGYNLGYVRGLTAEDIQVSASGDSLYVGGLSGYSANLYDYADEETTHTISNVRVYGRSQVGGLYGQSGSIRYATITGVSVVGTGDYVGGLRGYSSGNLYNLTISDVSVTSSGACVGGLVGRTTGSTVRSCTITNVTVTASGTASAATACVDSDTETALSSGDAVGGIYGANRGASVQFTNISNVKVYAGGSYVGGLTGLQYQYYSPTYMSVSGVTVYAPGGSYVGGLVGYAKTSSAPERNAAEDLVVTAGGSYVGGLVGWLSPYADSNNLGVYYNQIQATVTAGGSYAGGLIGCASELYQIDYNSVEATVTAGGDYTGGLVGAVLDPRETFLLNRNITVSVVSGGEYTGGQLGYANVTVGGSSGCRMYYNIVATKVTVDEANEGTASFFYCYKSDGGHVKDVLANSGTYPYRLYLWDSSTMNVETTADGETKTTTTSAAGYEFTNTIGSESTSVTKYWRGTAVEKEKSTVVSNANQLALVSTEDLQNRNLYYSGTDNLSFTHYTETIDAESGTVTYSDILTNMFASTGDRWNTYGLDAKFVSGSNGETTLMPTPINPLLLYYANASNINGTSYWVGSSQSGGGYFIGTATYVDDNTLKFELTDGIATPGTGDSILTKTVSVDGTLSDIEIKAAPQVYASNAYQLNVEFTSGDSIGGAVIEAHLATVAEADRTSTNALWSVTAETGTLTYTAAYDFQTDIVIEIVGYPTTTVTNTETKEETTTTTRQVYNTIEVEAYGLRSRVAMGSSCLYAIGSDGKIYLYQTSYSITGEEAGVNKSLNDGETFININIGTSGAVALTSVGRVFTLTSEGEGTLTGSLTSGGVIGNIYTDITSSGSVRDGNILSVASLQRHDLRSRHDLVATTDGDLSGLFSGTESEDKTSAESSDDESAAEDEAESDETEEDADTEEESGDNESAQEAVETDDESAEEAGAELDVSLLEAEPLYEFDYNGCHICTYLNYTLIYDGDDVILRNMQLFVKDDQLFALNAPDEIVPGSILIDTYQGATYMTVLRNDGVLVDLMDEINYPDDFVNRNIKNISNNLYSDLTYVQVEYEDGSIILFNYLTGGIISETEGDGSGGSTEDGDFWGYLTSFFRDKYETAYSEVTGAYRNAVEMKDYISSLAWRNLFGTDTSDGLTDGDAERDGATANLADTDVQKNTEGANLEGSTGDDKDDEWSTALASEAGSLAVDGDETEDEALIEEEDSLYASDEESEIVDGEQANSVSESDIDEYIEGVMADSETGEESAPSGFTSTDEPESAEGEGADAEAGEEISTGGGDAAEEDATEETAVSAEETTEEAETEGTASGSDESEEAEGSASSDGTFSDDIIIAYDADANGYALYSANDLLSGSSGDVVSVDQQLNNYLAAGGQLTGAKQLSLEVSNSQRSGMLVLGVTAGAIALLLVALLVQHSSRRHRRRSDRR